MIKYILFFLILCSVVKAKELRVIFSYATPPYVFEYDGSGIIVDITKKAFAQTSYEIKPIFVNSKRSFEMFKYGYADAIAMIQKSSGLGAYYSDIFVEYHVAAFALKSKKYAIKKIEDLKEYHFVGFQNARKYLGEQFSKVTKEARDNYSEVVDLRQQAYKFLKGRTDVILMDIYAFAFYKNELIAQGKIDPNLEVDVFEIFQPIQYRTAFKDKNTRDDFNKGLELLRVNGQYHEIYKKYNHQYFKIKI